MKVINYQNPKGFISNFDNLFDSFFNNNLSNFVGSDYFLSNPSTNIKETEEGYEIELAAPGLEKEDFKLNLDKDILTIEAKRENKSEKINESEETTEKFVRREFNFTSFKRSFTLPETVNAENIGAKYENGILNITLPKKEEAKPLPAKNIQIA